MSSDKDDDDEMVSQNKKNERNIIIKKLNDHFDKMIDKSKSFEEQIKSLKEIKIQIILKKLKKQIKKSRVLFYQ